jgi:hypothetical protein
VDWAALGRFFLLEGDGMSQETLEEIRERADIRPGRGKGRSGAYEEGVLDFYAVYLVPGGLVVHPAV